jgi:hypothetical protein
MKFRICFPILQSPMIILWFLLYVLSMLFIRLSSVLFLFIKRIPFILPELYILYSGLKLRSPSISHLCILEFLYTTTLRVVLVKLRPW